MRERSNVPTMKKKNKEASRRGSERKRTYAREGERESEIRQVDIVRCIHIEGNFEVTRTGGDGWSTVRKGAR